MNITRSLLNRQLFRLMSSSAQKTGQPTAILPQESLSSVATVEPSPRDDDLYRYLRIKCSCHETATLDSYEKFLRMTAEHLQITYVGTEEPFRTIKRRTLLASRFVKKKYRVQYEFRSYYRHILFKNLTGSTADTFLEYIERNLPEGVLLIAEKHRLAELPFEVPDRVESKEMQEPKKLTDS